MSPDQAFVINEEADTSQRQTLWLPKYCTQSKKQLRIKRLIKFSLVLYEDAGGLKRRADYKFWS